MPKKYHMGVHIDGALKKSDREIDGMLTEDGRELPAREIRALLKAEKSLGWKIFCGCDNRRPDGGCAGHEVEDF